MLAAATAIIPRFPASRKGAHGKLLVVGGSEHYVGAPYYASHASLLTGADLCWVGTSPAAAPSLKAHGELMVIPALEGDSRALMLEQLAAPLARADAYVVGPGLGRTACAELATRAVLDAARGAHVPCVVDADALWHVARAPELVRGAACFVLTPNGGELAQLVAATGGGGSGGGLSGDGERDGALLARRLGCVVLAKGGVDHAWAPGGEASVRCDAVGAPRRCGGQGDVLAGVLGTFLAWAALAEGRAAVAGAQGAHRTPPTADALLAACWGATHVTRAAARRAWNAKRRGMLTPDVLAALPEAFEDVFGRPGDEDGDGLRESPAAPLRE